MEYKQYNYFTINDFVNVDERDSELDKTIPYYFDLSKYNYNIYEIPNIISNILCILFNENLNYKYIYNYTINDYKNYINILLKIKLNNKNYIYYGITDSNV